jgi:Cytochrome C biogenesis protein transmembrane region
MLSSITPLGERGRNNRWWLTTTAYALGSVLGGASIGGLCGAVGWLAAAPFGGTASLPAAVPLAVLAGVGVLGALADLGAGRLRVPSIQRQVNENWIGSYRGWVYGIGYGYQLGLGVVTIVTSAITWVALTAAVLTGSVLGGVIVGAAFGLARAAPLLLAARVRHPAELRALHRRNQRFAPTARGLAIGAQVAVVGVALLLVVLSVTTTGAGT